MKDVASSLPRWAVSESGQGSGAVPGSSVPGPLRSTAPEAVLECSGSDEDVISLARRESRADFPEASSQLLDPSEWKLAACGGFFREAPGRLPILSDNIALVVALCEARSFFFSKKKIAFSHASDLCVWLQGKVLSHRLGGYRQS